MNTPPGWSAEVQFQLLVKVSCFALRHWWDVRSVLYTHVLFYITAIPNLIQSIKNNVDTNMSSQHTTWSSDKAIDGKPEYDPDTCTCCSTTDINDPNPTWKIDLGQSYRISIIEIISRSDYISMLLFIRFSKRMKTNVMYV